MITEVSVGAFSESAVVADKLNEVIRALNAIETASTSTNTTKVETLRLCKDCAFYQNELSVQECKHCSFQNNWRKASTVC